MNKEQKIMKKIVKRLQGHVDAHAKQRFHTMYSDRAFILDMLYAIGISIDPLQYCYRDGFERFKTLLRGLIRKEGSSYRTGVWLCRDDDGELSIWRDDCVSLQKDPECRSWHNADPCCHPSEGCLVEEGSDVINKIGKGYRGVRKGRKKLMSIEELFGGDDRLLGALFGENKGD